MFIVRVAKTDYSVSVDPRAAVRTSHDGSMSIIGASGGYIVAKFNAQTRPIVIDATGSTISEVGYVGQAYSAAPYANNWNAMRGSLSSARFIPSLGAVIGVNAMADAVLRSTADYNTTTHFRVPAIVSGTNSTNPPKRAYILAR
ncbi:MAG: hypothetical protein JNM11_12700 [Chitinimonas sp.]|nr:hypothetical protein [Chitinimonas sp.]